MRENHNVQFVDVENNITTFIQFAMAGNWLSFRSFSARLPPQLAIWAQSQRLFNCLFIVVNYSPSSAVLFRRHDMIKLVLLSSRFLFFSQRMSPPWNVNLSRKASGEGARKLHRATLGGRGGQAVLKGPSNFNYIPVNVLWAIFSVFVRSSFAHWERLGSEAAGFDDAHLRGQQSNYISTFLLFYLSPAHPRHFLISSLLCCCFSLLVEAELSPLCAVDGMFVYYADYYVPRWR